MKQITSTHQTFVLYLPGKTLVQGTFVPLSQPQGIQHLYPKLLAFHHRPLQQAGSMFEKLQR